MYDFTRVLLAEGSEIVDITKIGYPAISWCIVSSHLLWCVEPRTRHVS